MIGRNAAGRNRHFYRLSISPDPFRSAGPTKTFGDQADGSQIAIGQDDYQLISAVPADFVVGPNAFSQNFRDPHEDFVARLVATLIIDLFKRIQIKHDQTERGAGSPGADQFLVQELYDERPVP